MIFPFILLIADIVLWWLFSQVALLGEPLLSIGMFGLAFGGFLWAVWEVIELKQSFSSGGAEE